MECSPTGTYIAQLVSDWSQSPSIMECSPTFVEDSILKLGTSRSPRQLWNALLLVRSRLQLNGTGRSPRQLWNALLPTRRVARYIFISSQSPSIMECSPTRKSQIPRYGQRVAVPVNYGMLSYKQVHRLPTKTKSQSPSIMECSPTRIGHY